MERAVRVLLTGATGYIGGRLLPGLLEDGHQVRCLARTPAKLADQQATAGVEVVPGDVLDPASLESALTGCDAAYYLVHSMDSKEGWHERDVAAAAAFRDAAARAGVGQIIYLGGLGDDDDPRLSRHLSSRHEVGRVLAAGPVPVTELRAAVIIGSGSASFEMLRHLVETLPTMVTPRWVSTRCQPIAVRDVLFYLRSTLGDQRVLDRVLEIGGPDVLTYRDMMQVYAEVAGLPRRVVVTVPVLTPRLSSLWVGLVTPLPTTIARPLVDGLANEVVVRDPSVDDLFDRARLPYREAVRLAIKRVRDLDVESSWSDADRRRGAADPSPNDPSWAGGVVLDDEQVVDVDADPETVFATVCGIGGARGWLAYDWLWTIRGGLDLLAGGPGMRRGRRHPDQLRVGDAVDAWRVERVQWPSLLRLRAEMRLPGAAWLEWHVEPRGEGSRLIQRARFHPRGLVGRAYWYALAPAHVFIFGRMARALAAEATARSTVAVD